MVVKVFEMNKKQIHKLAQAIAQEWAVEKFSATPHKRIADRLPITKL